ncbi:MAG: MmcQ/YjbR family DNA-binding protein [Chloroflexi bacterium]|nr:MmcQ/YjbR family DNA-binding protein [Chloroflexota bacterium]
MDLRDLCLAQRGAIEDFPFGEDVRVIKVRGKMFALIPVGSDPASISLKCDPLLAQAMRDTYEAVQPGYHLSKKHWNTVTIDGSIPDNEIQDMIDLSYDLVVKGLTKKERAELAALDE